MRIVIVLVITIIVCLFIFRNRDVRLNYISDNNEKFQVRVDGSKDDSGQAGERLSKCVENVLKLKKFLKNKYGIGLRESMDESIDLTDVKKGLDIDKATYLRIYRFLKNFNENCFIENIPKKGEDTSYTEDKGTKIAICLRDDRGKLHDLNILNFVVLHEISHVLTKDYGHPDEFWYNFKWVLQNAVECGIYEPVDYKKYPVRYCSIDVSFNPLFDL